MAIYRARVPIFVESSDRSNRLSFTTEWGVRLDAVVTWEGLNCRLRSRDAQTVEATFAEVSTENQGAAFRLVCGALGVIVPMVSMQIQRGHVNRHYGPLRATWARRDVEVTPDDQWPTSSVAMRGEQLVDLSDTNSYLAASLLPRTYAI